jgi:hypothetical protein
VNGQLVDLFAGGIAGRQIIRARHEGVNHAEVHAHVPHGLAAHGAGVVVARVLPKAVAVHEVAAGQLLQHQPISQSVRRKEKKRFAALIKEKPMGEVYWASLWGQSLSHLLHGFISPSLCCSFVRLLIQSLMHAHTDVVM